MRQFIKENKEELDQIIKRAMGQCQYPRLNNDDRIDWINNDEGLYNWARRSGVRI
jgi:hypothetical protein